MRIIGWLKQQDYQENKPGPGLKKRQNGFKNWQNGLKSGETV